MDIALKIHIKQHSLKGAKLIIFGKAKDNGFSNINEN
jgi:hypothetical protein